MDEALIIMKNLLASDEKENVSRVRPIIEYIIHEKLELPNKMFTENYDRVPYPKSIVKNKSYARFGLEWECCIFNKLKSIYGNNFTMEDDYKFDIENEEYKKIFSLKEEEWKEYENDVRDSMELTGVFFEEKYKPNEFRIISNFEIKLNNIVGHPDVVVFNDKTKTVDVYDVKVFHESRRNSKTSKFIRCQISAYAALFRANGWKCNTVGIIMPWLRFEPVQIYNIENWDHAQLLNALIKGQKKQAISGQVYIKWGQLLSYYNVGFHSEKKIVKQDLRKLPPIQIFISGNAPGKDQELKSLKQPMNVRGRVYIHAPYNINLARDEEHIRTRSIEYLKYCEKYNFKGVVFHTGHHTDSKTGIDIMEKNMRYILKNVTSPKTFILETPCGEKNELLSYPKEFSSFIKKMNVSVCIDTCHVFVSGTKITKYIEYFDPKEIVLFHFNGSRQEFGSRKDGHCHVVYPQNIPDEELLHILKYAMNNKIDCVTE